MNKSKTAKKPPARCENKAQRVNLKCKRKRNLIKKAIELTNMLDMDIVMVMRDRDTGKLTKYTSGNMIKGHFTLQKALEAIEALNDAGNKIKVFDDDDYAKLRVPSA